MTLWECPRCGHREHQHAKLVAHPCRKNRGKLVALKKVKDETEEDDE